MSAHCSLGSILSHCRSDIDLNDAAFEELMHNAKGTNSEGGLFLYQSSGALKFILQERKDVHVIYNKNIFGDPEFDSIILLQDILNVDPKPRYIVFPFAIKNGHQISVVIDFERGNMVATDSLKVDRSSDRNLLDIKNGAGIDELVNGNSGSHYKTQKDPWSCGVYTVCNTLHQVNREEGSEDQVLDVDKYLEGILIASEKYSKIEERYQKERDERREQKRNLLEAIESLRDENGHFRNLESSDDLRKVADALQLENWKTIDRKEPDDNPNRHDPQDDAIRERDIQVFVEKYEAENKDDILGIVILYSLMRGGRYKDVIRYQQEAVKTGEMGFLSAELSSSPIGKSVNLAAAYIYISRCHRAREILVETMEESKDHPLQTEIYPACLYLLGVAATNLNQEAMAVSCFNKVIRFLQSRKEDVGKIGFCFMALGNVYQTSEKDNQALSYFVKAMAMFDDSYDKNDINIANCLLNMTPIYKRQGNLQKALECTKKAKEIYEKEMSKPDLVAKTSEYLGRLYVELGDMELAEKYTLEAKHVYEGIHGSRHYKIGSCLNNLGEVFFRRKQILKAKGYFEAAEVVFRDIDGMEHTRYADCLCNLGVINCMLSNYEQAIKQFTESNRIFSKAYGPMCPSISDNLDNLALAHSDLGNKTEALDCIVRSIRILRSSCGSQSLELPRSLINAITIYCKFGEPSKAKHCFQEAKEIYKHSSESVEKAQQPILANCLSKIATVYGEKRQDKEAIACLKEAHGIYEHVLGPSDHKIVATKTNMGIFYSRMGEYDEAIACLKLVEDIQTNAVPCRVTDLAMCYYNLGTMYRLKGDQSEAIAYLKKAKDLRPHMFA